MSRFSVAPLALLLTALVAQGCKDDKPTDPAPGKNQAGQTAGGAAGGPATVIDAPTSVFVYGGTIGVNAAVTQAKALAAKAMPQVPPLEQMIAPQIQGEFRLKTADVIDLSKPIRVAAFDPTGPDGARRHNPVALIIGITTKDAFIAALPETGRKTDDAGNAISYLKFEGAEKPIYVNFIDGAAVITREPGIYAEQKDFLAKLATAQLSGLGGLTIEVDHLMARYGKQFDRNLNKMAEMIQAASQGQATMGDPAAMAKVFAWLGQSAKEVDRVYVGLALQDDGLTLSARATPKDKSGLAELFTLLKSPGDASLLATLPASTVGFMSMSVAPEAMSRFTHAVNDMFVLGPIFAADPEKAKPYSAAMDAYAKAIDGRMAFGAWTGDAGISMAMIYGVKDAAAARGAMTTLGGLYDDPAAAAYYEKIGIKVSRQKAAYKVGDTDVDVNNTTMGAMGDVPQAQMVMQMMGDFFTQHLAIGEKLGVMAYGKDARPVVEGFLGGTMKGGFEATPAAKRAIAAAAPNHFMLGWANPIALARNLKLGGMNPLVGVLAGAEATFGLGLSLGVDKGELTFVIDVPAQLMKEGAAAAQKAMGAF